MNYLNFTSQKMKFSTYMSLEGALGFKTAVDFKKIIPNFISPKKDLYIDLNDLESIDIIGFNSLMMTKFLVNANGGDFFIFAKKSNVIFQLLDKIKLKDQFNFRDIIIIDSSYGIAS